MTACRSILLSAAASLALGYAGSVTAAPGIAWELVESLTTEVGPRLAGTPAEARARQWAISRLKTLGLSNVREETTQMPVWLRGAERAEIVSPFPQPLMVTAIGRSAATPREGLTAPLIYFRAIEDLKNASPPLVEGRIVFLSHAMQRAGDESQYAAFAEVRRSAPAIAAEKGAVAIVIRSLGTEQHRTPHTGLTTWAETTPIPAAALSIPDAETLVRILARNEQIHLRLTLTPTSPGSGTTGNVIAEIPGREAPDEIVLIGAHLDSWDLSVGAEDDAAGVAIVIDAAKRLLDRNVRPRRTVRVVLFGAEEIGLFGARDYARTHASEKHVVAIEMDHGSGPVLQLASEVKEEARPAVERLARSLAPLGVVLGSNENRLGADLNPLRELGIPTLGLRQRSSGYFDVHHTSNDTLDKIDAAGLEQAAEVLSRVVWELADSSESY